MRHTAGSRFAIKLRLAHSIAAIAVLTPATLFAQVGAGSLSGVVQDPSGAIIANATVTLANNSNGQQRVSRTGKSGTFNFAALPSGDYSLTVSSPGFGDFVNTDVHLNAGDTLLLPPARLEVGAAVSTVQVSGESGVLPLDNGQLSSTITAQDIDRLSIVGRDVTELQRILPGFAIRSLSSQNTAPDFTQVTIGQPTPYASNGAPVAGITLKLDGANLTDAGSLGANLQNINASFVSEVQVQTSNFGSDQSNGPVLISGVTKSGTSQLHGSLYTFARTSQLNANDALAKYDGFARPNDRYLYPGGTLSGPVPHLRKLTFFVGGEFDAQKNAYAYDSSSSAVVQALVPTAAMRRGDFSQAALQQYLGPQYTSGSYAQISPTPTVGDNGSPLNNGNIAAYLDPGAIALINYLLPLPNIPGGTNAQGFNYRTENLVDNNIFQTVGRLDFAATQKDVFFVRHSYEQGNQGQPQIPYYSPQAGSILGSVNTPGGGLLNKIEVHSAAANYVHVFTPTLTNEVYATGTYFREDFVPKTPSAFLKSTAGYPYNGIFANGSQDIPQFSTYAEYGGLPLALNPDFSLGPLFLKKVQPNGGDNVTKVFGHHSIKAGVFIERVVNNQALTNGTSNGAIQNYYFGPAGAAFHSYAGQYPNGTPAFDPTTHYNSGNTLANFFEGQVQDYHQQSFLPTTNLYFWNVDEYAQDTWRTTSNLSITFGVRLTHLGAWTDVRNNGPAIENLSTIAQPINAATLPFPGFTWHGLNPAVSKSGTGSTAVYAEPRAGFAWDVFRTGRTIVRGGAGVYRFHDAETDVDGAFQTASGLRTADLQGFGGNTLAGVNSVMQNPATYGNGGFTGTQTQLPIASVNALNPNDHAVPVTNNYSFSIAQQLPGKSILQVSYVGNNSNSLLNNGTTQAVTLNNINAIPVGTLFTAAAAAKINAASPGACNATGCTPDHWHKTAAVDSMNAGKDVYLEKPMIHLYSDGPAIIDAANRSGRICQVGSQRVSSIVYSKAKDLLASGIIGKLNMVTARWDRNSSLGAWNYTIPLDASPETCDWTRFEGSAPKMPFSAERFFQWRKWNDYGSGVAGDLFVHLFSGTHFITGAHGPTRAMATGAIRFWKDGRDADDVLLALFDYPEGFNLSLHVNFVDGGEESEGFLFTGSEGIVEIDGFTQSVRVTRTPLAKEPGYTVSTFADAMQKATVAEYRKKYPVQHPAGPPPETVETFTAPAGYSDSYDHFQNFFRCVRSRQPVVEDATFGFRASGAALLANVSNQRDAIVHWDPETMQIVDGAAHPRKG